MSLHVLVIPSAYPRREEPNSGVFYKEQTEGLRRAGVQVAVVHSELRSLRNAVRPAIAFANHWQVSETIENGVPVVRRHAWAMPHARLRMQLWVADTVGLVERYAARCGWPDVIHAHGALFAGIAAKHLWTAKRIPFVLTEHSTAFGRGLIRAWQERIIREVMHEASGLVAVGKALARLLEPYAAGKRIEVIPNFIDTNFFAPPKEPRRENEGQFRVLSIGYLTPKKGMDVLIEAFAAAFSDDRSALLDIAGDGPERCRLEMLARARGVEEQVRFLGSLSRSEVRDTMWRANAFALASRVETFGVVLIEALATGLPVVATMAGGPEDIVDERVGSLVRVGDVGAFAGALRVMRRQWHQYDVATLRNHVLERFSEGVVAQRVIDVLERAAGVDG